MSAEFLHATDLGSDTDDEDYVPDPSEVEGLSEERDEEPEGKESPSNRRRVGVQASVKEEEEKEDLTDKKELDDLWAGMSRFHSSTGRTSYGETLCFHRF